ncbi:uncharacterized protein PHACADRAFT_262771 [Phanerochaete carnosa HHB-10118-sp]|uniref:Uncharacterized protein n=1 Tax=Phanerochaete carnosa (strain HHB-10118-sp) TaxID=650164 RepID=K5VI14_PHACS|nr:uncharacterized protein PHACADRAFT_262771 [Phanerochaete carnosa HHB-10118-sp]EKM50893.1 hypothetical protein PHACADRAFT_262771 [Phanerochaete carnosa HHB-10118-sp]
MIQSSAWAMDLFTKGLYDDRSVYHAVDVVRFCFLHVQLYTKQDNRDAELATRQDSSGQGTKRPNSATWASLWKEIGTALRKYFAEEQWQADHTSEYWSLLRPRTPEELLADDRQLAGECLEIMESAEHGGSDYSSFPDELIVALGLFILPEDVPKYPRLVKLQERRDSQSSDQKSNPSPVAAGQAKITGQTKTAGEVKAAGQEKMRSTQ